MIDPLNRRCNFINFYYRGAANFSLLRFKEAYNDSTESLRIDENNADCLRLRAHSHHKLGEYEDCIIDCEESLKLKMSKEATDLMKKATDALKSAKRKKKFEILGVASSTTREETKKAFYKLSLQFHSDKHPNATAIDKKKLDRKFREINDAYNLIMKTFDV